MTRGGQVLEQNTEYLFHGEEKGFVLAYLFSKTE